jgi:abequosyltransferase
MLLSICIPTYNFGAFIGETLDSIAPNLCDETEVVILDGGSTDNTSEVVGARQANHSQIRYYNQGFRGGIDRDIAKVVSLSRGTYCWLFSADDIMKPGAVKTILDFVKTKCDVYLCEQTMCAADMRPLYEHPIFNNIESRAIFNLNNRKERLRYFRSARTSEAFFSYLAGPIFTRALWDRAAGIPESFYETCWGLAGRLLSQVPAGIVVQYTGESLIYKRSGVDSFMEKGIVNRLRITIDGFAHIAEKIFGKASEETFHIRRVIRNEATFRFRNLISIKIAVSKSGGIDDVEALNKIVFHHYSNAGCINIAKYYIFRWTPISMLWMLKMAKDYIRISRLPASKS